MQIIKKDQSRYVLRFDKGEELLEELKKFCENKKIYAAFFYGIGAADAGIISYYNLEEGFYEDQEIKGHHEVVNLMGNVTKGKEELMIHVHGTLADKQLKPIAGHIKKLKISWTIELKLDVFPGTIKKVVPDGAEAARMEVQLD